MALATKFCASAISIGLRSLTSCGNTLQTMANRNFHVMVARPFVAPTSSGISSKIGYSLTAPIMPAFSKLLQPFNSILNQVAGFKVKARLRRRCKDCYIVIRQQRHYVICPTHPRHKQMSMKKRDYKSWILTHATQSKVRPY